MDMVRPDRFTAADESAGACVSRSMRRMSMSSESPVVELPAASDQAPDAPTSCSVPEKPEIAVRSASVRGITASRSPLCNTALSERACEPVRGDFSATESCAVSRLRTDSVNLTEALGDEASRIMLTELTEGGVVSCVMLSLPEVISVSASRPLPLVSFTAPADSTTVWGASADTDTL